MITVGQHAQLSEIGQRSNQEDSWGAFGNKLFVVCDGVGGSEKGEVASEMLVNTFIKSFSKNEDAKIEEVVKETEQKFSSYIKKHPEAAGMASTLTFLQVKANGILVAWCGDSRVYQFRNGKIIYRTADHSWVNEAVEAGIITAEEAIGHPKSRIITKAIQGTHKPENVAVHFITDIREGDLLLQCTDGVLESWTDQELEKVTLAEPQPSKIIEELANKCRTSSKDNFTAIVFSIGEASLSGVPAKRNRKFFVRIIFFSILLLLAIYLYKRYNKKATAPIQKTQVKKSLVSR